MMTCGLTVFDMAVENGSLLSVKRGLVSVKAHPVIQQA